MLVDTMCKCKHIYKYVLPIYENVSKSCKCPHEFACMLALEWAARYLGKDPSQLSSQICQVAILCRSFQIASTCTSLLAKFEAQFTTELLLTLVISCETAISHYTKCPGRTPHRPQDQFGAETCKAQLWIWKCKDPSLGKWRRNCKGVSRWKVRFMHEAWRYQWGLWQISNNTVASGFCIIHSGIHSYISCLDYIKLSFHPNPHHSQTHIKNFQGTGLHEKQTWIMNLQVASSAQSTAFCILLQAIWMQKFEQTSTTSTLTAGFWLASPNSEVAISKKLQLKSLANVVDMPEWLILLFWSIQSLGKLRDAKEKRTEVAKLLQM